MSKSRFESLKPDNENIYKKNSSNRFRSGNRFRSNDKKPLNNYRSKDSSNNRFIH